MFLAATISEPISQYAPFSSSTLSVSSAKAWLHRSITAAQRSATRFEWSRGSLHFRINSHCVLSLFFQVLPKLQIGQKLTEVLSKGKGSHRAIISSRLSSSQLDPCIALQTSRACLTDSRLFGFFHEITSTYFASDSSRKTFVRRKYRMFRNYCWRLYFGGFPDQEYLEQQCKCCCRRDGSGPGRLILVTAVRYLRHERQQKARSS